MEHLDGVVLAELADKVFAKDRLQILMGELRKRIKSSKDDQQDRIGEINSQIKKVEDRQHRLLEAIETGTIELDEMTQRRAQQIKVSREALFIELAGVRRDTALPAVEYLKASQVDMFGKVLREKLLAANSPLAKNYLNILVDEIVVKDKTATIRGSYSALAETMQQIKTGNLSKQVPSFIPEWCARRDSNS
jgi:site-specific DNA recombinase